MSAAQRSAPPMFGMTVFAGNFSLYHHGETNRCPSCNGNQWHVGRQSAECGRCACAVPFASPYQPTQSLKDITNAPS